MNKDIEELIDELATRRRESLERIRSSMPDLLDLYNWPEEERIDIIGANGPTGEHYD